MKRITLTILGILVAALTFQGCVNLQHNRAKRLARVGYNKIKQAIALDPSIVDSLHRIDTVTFIVEAKQDSAGIESAIDTTAFHEDIQNYDSLSHANNKLLDEIEYGALTGIQKEQALAQARRNEIRLQEQRDNFLRGYQVDSTYRYEDEYLIGDIIIKDGLLRGFKYEIKEQKLDTAITTTTIIVDGSKPDRGFLAFFWKYIGIIIPVIVLLVVIILLRSAKKMFF